MTQKSAGRPKSEVIARRDVVRAELDTLNEAIRKTAKELTEMRQNAKAMRDVIQELIAERAAEVSAAAAAKSAALANKAEQTRQRMVAAAAKSAVVGTAAKKRDQKPSTVVNVPVEPTDQ